MASFKDIIKKIVGIEHALAPVLAFIPGVGPFIVEANAVVAHIQSIILAAEVNDPRDGQGKSKENLILGDFAASMEVLQFVLSTSNQKAEWDVDLLKEANADQVRAYNTFSKFVKSIKVVTVQP